jgi:hypothetical protein
VMSKGAERRMNRAEEDVHKMPKAGGRPHTAGVGSERPVSPSVDQLGGPKAEARGSVIHDNEGRLGHAMHELKSQHPHHHMDRGPHHGGHEHIRHEPMHGLRPGGHHNSEHGRHESRHREHMKHGK